MNSQDKYPLCYDLGFKGCYISIDDLEAVLQKATVVYSSKDASGDLYEWTKEKYAGCTHESRLIGIKELKPKTLSEKIIEWVYKDQTIDSYKIMQIKKLIEEEK